MHCVWTLPEGDGDFPGRWRAIKIAFSKSLPAFELRSPVMTSRGERGVWQRPYWEHTIRDDQDFATHMDYTHLHPVKHGLVEHPADWPHSSFRRCVASGLYPAGWIGRKRRVTTRRRTAVKVKRPRQAKATVEKRRLHEGITLAYTATGCPPARFEAECALLFRPTPAGIQTAHQCPRTSSCNAIRRVAGVSQRRGRTSRAMERDRYPRQIAARPRRKGFGKDQMAHFNSKQQVFLAFVLSHYVRVGVEELDREKLRPLLSLKYHAIADAVADLGRPEEIGKVFAGSRSISIRMRHDP
jgi:hypothetical protein